MKRLRAGELPPELRRDDIPENESVYVTVETLGEHTARLFHEIGTKALERRRELGVSDADVDKLLEELGFECRDD